MKIVYVISFILLSGIFVFSMSAVFSYHKDARENAKEIEEVIREAVLIPPEVYEEEKEGTDTGRMEDVQIDFEKLRERNTDTAGWIVFHYPHVNYPLVHTTDNAYYLNHSFTRESSAAGSIFLDCRNESLEDKNVVIYGHNMLNGTMFGSLKDVFQEDFREEEGSDLIFLFDTERHLRKYRIFSYYTVEKEDYYITTCFRSDAEYTEFLEAVQARSFGQTDVAVTAADHILTLSTCTGVSGAKRRVIHAKLL